MVCVDVTTPVGWSRDGRLNWYRERRSLILMVPSVVARIEMNILINPDHPDFSRITHGLHQPVWWDERLYPETDTGLA
jgi:RES domain-containing protein